MKKRISIKYPWSNRMPDEKKEIEKPKPSERFIYNEDDVAHIFRLGDIGTVFDTNENTEKSSILLKKLVPIKKNVIK
jgi:hypothetical protein